VEFEVANPCGKPTIALRRNTFQFASIFVDYALIPLQALFARHENKWLAGRTLSCVLAHNPQAVSDGTHILEFTTVEFRAALLPMSTATVGD
jgi:hypothetical protein